MRGRERVREGGGEGGREGGGRISKPIGHETATSPCKHPSQDSDTSMYTANNATTTSRASFIWAACTIARSPDVLPRS